MYMYCNSLFSSQRAVVSEVAVGPNRAWTKHSLLTRAFFVLRGRDGLIQFIVLSAASTADGAASSGLAPSHECALLGRCSP